MGNLVTIAVESLIHKSNGGLERRQKGHTQARSPTAMKSPIANPKDMVNDRKETSKTRCNRKMRVKEAQHSCLGRVNDGASVKHKE